MGWSVRDRHSRDGYAMKVAVTGATGFVGKHVLRALSARAEVEVTASSRNPAPPGSLPIGVHHVALNMTMPSPDDYDRLGRPDVLIHLAWSGLPNYKSLHHFETELPSQYTFLRHLVDAGLPSLFVTGTCYEYGMQCGPQHESMVSAPCNPYAFAKTALRQQLEYLSSLKNVKLTWARLFYMFGRWSTQVARADGQRDAPIWRRGAGAIPKMRWVRNRGRGICRG